MAPKEVLKDDLHDYEVEVKEGRTIVIKTLRPRGDLPLVFTKRHSKRLSKEVRKSNGVPWDTSPEVLAKERGGYKILYREPLRVVVIPRREKALEFLVCLHNQGFILGDFRGGFLETYQGALVPLDFSDLRKNSKRARFTLEFQQIWKALYTHISEDSREEYLGRLNFKAPNNLISRSIRKTKDR